MDGRLSRWELERMDEQEGLEPKGKVNVLVMEDWCVINNEVTSAHSYAFLYLDVTPARKMPTTLWILSKFMK